MKSGVVAHTLHECCNPSTHEAKARGSLPAQGHPGLHRGFKVRVNHIARPSVKRRQRRWRQRRRRGREKEGRRWSEKFLASHFLEPYPVKSSFASDMAGWPKSLTGPWEALSSQQRGDWWVLTTEFQSENCPSRKELLHPSPSTTSGLVRYRMQSPIHLPNFEISLKGWSSFTVSLKHWLRPQW